MSEKLEPISLHEIQRLRDERHAVYVYPRKALVVVDGFKRHRIAPGLAPRAAKIARGEVDA